MTTAINQVDQELTEALRTVAINSAYHASRALSKWFKRGVRLTSDGFTNVPLSELTTLVGEPDEPVVAVHMALTGDLDGDIVLAFPESVAFSLVDIMIGAPAGTSNEMGEMERSCLQETGNIVASALTNSLATWLAVEVAPASPVVVHDLACAVIQPLIVNHAAVRDDAMIAKTDFDMDGQRMDWSLLLLPSIKSLSVMQGKCNTERIRRHALQTIAVNGAFNASRAMSKWLTKGVHLTTEGFSRVALREIVHSATPDDPVVALHAYLGDQLHGHTLMVLPIKTACELVDVLMQLQVGTTTELDEMARSCLQETGNIISGAFINSWAKWLDIHAEPGVPTIQVDLPEAIIDELIVEQAAVGDDVFMAKSSFSVHGRNVSWDFYFLPTPASLRLIEASCE